MSGSGQNGGVNVVNDKPFWKPQQMEESACTVKCDDFKVARAPSTANAVPLPPGGRLR